MSNNVKIVITALLLFVSLSACRGSDAVDFAGTYHAVMPTTAVNSPGRDITLVLYADNTVTLTTDHKNGEPPMIEEGTWTTDGNSAPSAWMKEMIRRGLIVWK